MDLIKTFAGYCAPGAEATCDAMLQGIKEHQQNQAYVILSFAIIFFLTAIVLIIFCIAKSKRQ